VNRFCHYERVNVIVDTAHLYRSHVVRSRDPADVGRNAVFDLGGNEWLTVLSAEYDVIEKR
jgi:hypothetical protein